MFKVVVVASKGVGGGCGGGLGRGGSRGGRWLKQGQVRRKATSLLGEALKSSGLRDVECAAQTKRWSTLRLKIPHSGQLSTSSLPISAW